MNFSDVQYRVEEALKLLNKKDKHLMDYNLNEQAIAHQLAVKLAKYFVRLTVDCEYNGNVNANKSRKEIQMLNDKLGKFKSRRHKPHLPREELINLSVTPDIIIHKRGHNRDNLLIVEIKKSTNKNIHAFEFDEEKIKAYTLPEGYSNDKSFFRYKFGLILIIGCLEHKNDELIWYENAEEKCRESIPKSVV